VVGTAAWGVVAGSILVGGDLEGRRSPVGEMVSILNKTMQADVERSKWMLCGFPYLLGILRIAALRLATVVIVGGHYGRCIRDQCRGLKCRLVVYSRSVGRQDVEK
jgi:hypothetical protein